MKDFAILRILFISVLNAGTLAQDAKNNSFNPIRPASGLKSMAFPSYRAFLEKLAAQGELIRVAQPVATELEITAIADREMKKPEGGKALLFEKPTVNGQISPFLLAINTLGSHKRMAMSMGLNSVDEA